MRYYCSEESDCHWSMELGSQDSTLTFYNFPPDSDGSRLAHRDPSEQVNEISYMDSPWFGLQQGYVLNLPAL